MENYPEQDSVLKSIILGRAEAFAKQLAAYMARNVETQDHKIPQTWLLTAEGMRVLLDDDGWNEEYRPIVAAVKSGVERIRNILLDKGLIPEGIEHQLIEFAQHIGFFPYDDNYEDIFDRPLDAILKKGYRKIDVDLIVAALSLNFDEVRKLLEQGANPDVDVEDDEDPHEFVSSLMLTGMGWDDAYTPCGDIHLLWRDEYLEGDANVINAERDSCQIIASAANKLMYQLLLSHCPDSSE